MTDLTKKIEAALFFKGEPLTIKKLADILNISESDVVLALNTLERNLDARGIRLMRKDDEVMLGTAPDCSALIEGLIKEDLNKELGKAGIETLATILYLGPIARSKVDYIRGVNSAFITRNLMVRGLVERISNPDDQRSFLYRPTFELLSYLGVTNISELPEYDAVRAEISLFKNARAEDGGSGGLKNEPESAEK